MPILCVVQEFKNRPLDVLKEQPAQLHVHWTRHGTQGFRNFHILDHSLHRIQLPSHRYVRVYVPVVRGACSRLRSKLSHRSWVFVYALRFRRAAVRPPLCVCVSAGGRP